jgi:hypothetical protein
MKTIYKLFSNPCKSQCAGKSAVVTDCRPRALEENGNLSTESAKWRSASELILANRTKFYDWGQHHHRFARGRAFIFHDDVHVAYAFCLEECFQSLGYDVKIMHIEEMQEIIC